MERLKSDVEAMSKHVSSLPDNPSMDQIQSKVKSISTALKNCSSSLPPRIKQIIADCFAEMGWDIVRQRVSQPSLFTFLTFKHCLDELKEQLNNWSPPLIPSDEEIHDLSKACSKLWELDVHRLVPDVDYLLNLQQGKRAYDQGDYADLPLFTFVDAKVFSKPTFASFVALLDNYFAATGQTEVVTDVEKAEQKKFLNLCMDTQVMQYVHQYLVTTKRTNAFSREQFIAELEALWFGLYSRKARNDSSGFEHVFVGEIKEETHEIVGFHNWIQIYLEEKANGKKPRNFDYKGFIKPKRRALPSSFPPSHEQLVTIQFEWRGAVKNVSSSLIGTSPEFELALYTLCFYAGEQEESIVQLGPYKVKITCFRWPANPRPGDKIFIATSFPSEVPLDENEAATKIQARARGRFEQRSKKGH